MTPVGRADTIGVLGGMGPLATADFLTKIVQATPAFTDHEHLPVLVANLPHIPDRQAAARGDGVSPVPAMVAVRDLLVGAGAQCLAMPCNSAHAWYDELVDGCPVPFLHIVDAARDALDGAPLVGVLGAAATLRTGLYPARLADGGVKCVDSSELAEAAVEAVRTRVKTGDVAGSAGDLEAAIADQLGRGAERVILACTELPLVTPHLSEELAAVCVDATDALARACVRWGLAAR